jgi:hypothetical protein
MVEVLEVEVVGEHRRDTQHAGYLADVVQRTSTTD